MLSVSMSAKAVRTMLMKLTLGQEEREVLWQLLQASYHGSRPKITDYPNVVCSINSSRFCDRVHKGLLIFFYKLNFSMVYITV